MDQLCINALIKIKNVQGQKGLKAKQNADTLKLEQQTTLGAISRTLIK